MIRLRFVTGDDWISNAIRVGERDGWCTHVEAVMPDGTLLGAHLDGGVQAACGIRRGESDTRTDRGPTRGELLRRVVGRDSAGHRRAAMP